MSECPFRLSSQFSNVMKHCPVFVVIHVCCNKDPLYLKNWRPISLLNTATKRIAKRLEKVLPELINRDQTGYIKNRFIEENIRLISDVIDSYDENNLPGFLLFIDFEKAFDSLEWSFLFKSLEVMNFGPVFQRWIRTFYSNISSCVINNGYTTRFFPLKRGVRQGCPLSGLLFSKALPLWNLYFHSPAVNTTSIVIQG